MMAEDKLDKLMTELGFVPQIRGTIAMRQAVLLYLQGKRKFLAEIYPEIARTMGCTAAAVEISMRYAVERMWWLGPRTRQYEVIGRWRPTVSDCVRRIAGYVCAD